MNGDINRIIIMEPFVWSNMHFIASTLVDNTLLTSQPAPTLLQYLRNLLSNRIRDENPRARRKK